MKKILIIIAIIIVALTNTKDNNIIIPNNAIRFRVIANSNTFEDQEIKNNVSVVFQNYISKLTNTANSAENAKETLLSNYDNLDNYLQTYFKENRIDQEYNLSIGNNYFPKKIYNGVTYNAGYYDSIVLKLGRSNGLNWWCVIYPPLCNIDSKKIDNKLQYTTLIQEALRKHKL